MIKTTIKASVDIQKYRGIAGMQHNVSKLRTIIHF